MASVRRAERAWRATRLDGELKRLVQNAGMLVIAISLCGLVLAHSLAAHLTNAKPEWALIIHPSNPNALLRIAEADVANMIGRAAASAAPPGSESADAIRSQIIAALYSNPLNAHAFELLGMLASADAKADAADVFMRAALSLSSRCPAALYWMATHAKSNEDIASSINYADLFLRVRPEAISIVVPALARIASSPEGEKLLVLALSKTPAWRSVFFRFLKTDVRYADFTLQLLLGLRATGSPPSNQEVDEYVRALVIAHQFQRAYYAWLQLLPVEKVKYAGLLFNGDFRFAPTSSPFDWTVRIGDGVISEIAADNDRPGKNILALTIVGGRVGFRPVEQFVVLPPGKYRMSGAVRGILNGPRGLKWRVTCLVPSIKTAGETAVLGGAFPKATEFSAAFDVSERCAAQSVHLVLEGRTASETSVSGSVAFSDLKIMREQL